MTRRFPNIALHRQRGVTSLFVTVIVLLVVTLLAVTAMVLSGTQFKLAGNLQLENDAFNQAESTMAVAQNWLAANSANTGFASYSSGTTPYLYPITTASPDPYTAAWTDSNSLALSSTQRYRIKKIGENLRLPGDIEVGVQPLNCVRADEFRITARATGVKGSEKIVETTYTVPAASSSCI